MWDSYIIGQHEALQSTIVLAAYQDSAAVEPLKLLESLVGRR